MFELFLILSKFMHDCFNVKVVHQRFKQKKRQILSFWSGFGLINNN